MKTQWRPLGWKNPYLVGADLVEEIYKRKGMSKGEIWQSNFLHEAFEAGADTLLEALKSKTDTQYGEGIINPAKTKNGWLVFIPDEKKGG